MSFKEFQASRQTQEKPSSFSEFRRSKTPTQSPIDTTSVADARKREEIKLSATLGNAGIPQDGFLKRLDRGIQNTFKTIGRFAGTQQVGEFAGKTLLEGAEIAKDIGQFARTGEVRDREVMDHKKEFIKGVGGAAQIASLGIGTPAIAGKATLLGRMGQAAKVGATMGAIEGTAAELGESGEFTRDTIESAGIGAALGTGLGLLPGAVKLSKPFVQKFGRIIDPLVQDLSVKLKLDKTVLGQMAQKAGMRKEVFEDVDKLKEVLKDKNKIKKAGSLLENINRTNPAKAQKFTQQHGESIGEYLASTGIYTDRKNTISTLSNRFVESKQAADKGLDLIQGEYRHPALTAVVDENARFIEKIRNKGVELPKDAQEQFNIIQKFVRSGQKLNMTDANSSKRFFEKYNKYASILDKAPTAEVKRLSDLDDSLRAWQFDVAEQNGFGELKEINKQTQKARQALDALEEKELRMKANNPVSLTDWIIASEIAGNPQAIAVLIGKKAIPWGKINAYRAKMIAKGATKEQVKVNATKILDIQKDKVQKETLDKIQQQIDDGLKLYDKNEKEALDSIKDAIDKLNKLALPSPSGQVSAKVVNVKPIAPRISRPKQPEFSSKNLDNLGKPQPKAEKQIKSSTTTVSKADDLVKRGVIKPEEKALAESLIKNGIKQKEIPMYFKKINGGKIPKRLLVIANKMEKTSKESFLKAFSLDSLKKSQKAKSMKIAIEKELGSLEAFYEAVKNREFRLSELGFDITKIKVDGKINKGLQKELDRYNKAHGKK